MNITWEPPPTDQTNGIIDYYAIRVHASDTAEEFNYEASETQLILSELHPYYTYTVYVAAFTVSLGPYSAGRTVKMPADSKIIFPLNFHLISILQSLIT